MTLSTPDILTKHKGLCFLLSFPPFKKPGPVCCAGSGGNALLNLEEADRLTRMKLIELNNDDASNNQKMILALALTSISEAIECLMEFEDLNGTLVCSGGG